MEDDSLIQLWWDMKCAAAPKCAGCGTSVYTYDTYVRIGGYLFCECCAAGSDRLHSEDLDL